MSMSQLSIVQPQAKRQRSTMITDNISIQSNRKRNQTRLTRKPNYLNTSDHIFKTMLKTSLPGSENVIQLLDTSEKLRYARIYAQLVNDLFYLRLKHNYWTYYYQVVINSKIWSLTWSKQFIKENNLSQIRFLTKDNVERHQQIIIETIKHIENKLNQHKQQSTTDRLSNVNKLSTIIPAFVRKRQHKLSTEFERKKLLFQFDINDYCLVQKFHDLKPTEDQV